MISLVVFTIINVAVIEGVFLLARKFLKEGHSAKGFLTTLGLTLFIFYFSFGGLIAQISKHLEIMGNYFTLLDLLLIGGNIFWAVFRGLFRIFNLVKSLSENRIY
jgi:hypothetical protein